MHKGILPPARHERQAAGARWASMPGDRLETMVTSMMVLPECTWSTSVRINLVFASASRDASAAAICCGHLQLPPLRRRRPGGARAAHGGIEGVHQRRAGQR